MKQYLLAIAITAITTVVITIYSTIDPASSTLFPKCPSLLLTGYRCAGCGTQRAIHHLLNFDIAAAMSVNPLFVVSLPILTVMIWVEYFDKKAKLTKIRTIIYGKYFGLGVLITLIVYTIARNIFDF